MWDALGLKGRAASPEFPFAPDAKAVPLSDGAVYLLPARYALPLRRVVGVTLDVRRVDEAATRLQSAHVPFRTLAAPAGVPSLIVDPDDAHGIWLELREQRTGAAAGS